MQGINIQQESYYVVIMKSYNRVLSKSKRIINILLYSLSKHKKTKYNYELDIQTIKAKYFDRKSLYMYFHHYFWNIAPKWLKDHRKYFKLNNRGFGEDAFHAMWYKIFQEYHPKIILEIGVYRGQTISLFSLIAKHFNYDIEIHAISPFTPAGDSVSLYLNNLNYHEDVNKNFHYFNLPLPIYHKGLSTDLIIINSVSQIKFDLIYIDGNHDYNVVQHDFNVYSKLLNTNGIIVLDDASLYTDYKASGYSTAGHDGPSRVANELEKKYFKEILSVGHNRVFKRMTDEN